MRRVEATITDERLEIGLHVVDGESAELEIFAAEERVGLLSAGLEREVGFRVV